MAYLFAFSTELVLVGSVVGYAIFTVRRFGPVGPWPRGWRLGLLWLAALAGVGAFGTAVLGVGKVGGFIYCGARFSPSDLWPCSLGGRLVYVAGSLGIGIPLFAIWMRYTKRVLTDRVGHDA